MHLSVRRQTDQLQNPNYKEDIIYVTKHNKWILNCIGIWPTVLKGIGKFLPKVVIGFSNLVPFFTIVQCVLYITLEEKNPLLRLRFCSLAWYSSINLMKYWALIARKSDIEYCIKWVQTDWKQVSRASVCELLSGKVIDIAGSKYQDTHLFVHLLENFITFYDI